MSIYLRRRLRLSMCCTSYVWKNNTVLRIILRALRLRITSRFPKWAITCRPNTPGINIASTLHQ